MMHAGALKTEYVLNETKTNIFLWFEMSSITLKKKKTHTHTEIFAENKNNCLSVNLVLFTLKINYTRQVLICTNISMKKKKN